MGLKLPAVPDNMARWQQRTGVYQTVDPSGNWARETDKDISDTANNITETAGKKSTETVGTTKTITAGANVLIEAPSFTIKALGGGGVSLLPELTGSIEDIIAALRILANHTHPSVAASDESGAISEKADLVKVHNDSIVQLMG